MPELSIKKVGISDLSLLCKFAKAIFVHSFGKYNYREDMDKYLAEEMSEEKLIVEINDINNLFFIVFVGEKIVGFAKLRFGIQIDAPENCEPIEIERIYVSAELQNRKIGTAIINHCTGYARDNCYDTIWLGVWEHNYKAISFYERYGFNLFGAHNFLLGNDLQTDVLMKFTL